MYLNTLQKYLERPRVLARVYVGVRYFQAHFHLFLENGSTDFYEIFTIAFLECILITCEMNL